MSRFGAKGSVAMLLVGAGLFGLVALQGQTTPAEVKKETPVAGKQTYQIDPIHSSNWFRIKHLNVANFYGRFDEMAGHIVVDDANPAADTFDVTMKATSINTHNEMRDKDLKSERFFDVEHYPAITFKSRSVKKISGDELEVEGDMTLRGVTKGITVKITRTGTGPGLHGETRSGFETSFEIKRSDYGMTALMGGLSDEVQLTVSMECIRQ